MERLVVNADDFGVSSTVNQAVVAAHRFGSLRSASLVVVGEAAEEAVELARLHPDLAVGLHLVVSEGRPASPAERVPHLIGDDGRLSRRPLLQGLRYAVSPVVRVELGIEIAAQFLRFQATGLPLSHVDGHLHMHLHPAVLPEVVRLTLDHGGRAVRIPSDDLWLSLPHQPARLPAKLWWWATLGSLGRHSRGRLAGTGLVVVDRVYGLMQTGAMSEAYVKTVLRRSRARTVEIYFHPDTASRRHRYGPNPGDLATLLSSAVRDAIREAGGPATFAELASEQRR